MRLSQKKYQNTIFNLDQYGHSLVNRNTLSDILLSFKSAEIFLTFSISSLTAFLNKKEPEKMEQQIKSLNLNKSEKEKLIFQFSDTISNKKWLGLAEKRIFDVFCRSAVCVTTFSIHSSKGWKYWLIHFANKYRAQQVYKDLLHDNSTMQAHYGKSGLQMLAYDPRHEKNSLYLFDTNGRKTNKEQLKEDLPQLISGYGDAILIDTLYTQINNMTTAHSEDIKAAIFDSEDLDVFTSNGNKRQKSHTISPDDIIKFKPQRRFNF